MSVDSVFGTDNNCSRMSTACHDCADSFIAIKIIGRTIVNKIIIKKMPLNVSEEKKIIIYSVFYKIYNVNEIFSYNLQHQHKEKRDTFPPILQKLHTKCSNEMFPFLFPY